MTGFTSTHPIVFEGRHSPGPIPYASVVLEGQTRVKGSYFLRVVYNWPQSVMEGAQVSQLHRTRVHPGSPAHPAHRSLESRQEALPPGGGGKL